MNSSLSQAVRAARAVLRRVRVALSDRTTTSRVQAIDQYATTPAAKPCEPDMILLAALTLGGLMDPAVAVAIAILEADRLHHQHQIR